MLLIGEDSDQLDRWTIHLTVLNLRPQNVDQKPQESSNSHELLEVMIKFVTGFSLLVTCIVIGNRTIDGRCWKCWVEVNDRYICICMCIACAIAMEKYRARGDRAYAVCREGGRN